MAAPGQLSNADSEPYATAVWGSSGFHASTWTGFQTVSFGINGIDMLDAIANIQTYCNSSSPSPCPNYANLSTNLSNYVLVHVNYNPEIYYDGANAELGTSFQNMTVTTTPSMAQPFFRLYSAAYNRHFYTTSAVEAKEAISQGYVLDGPGYAGQLYPNQATSGLVELHRYFRASDHDHFYTITPSEVTPSEGYVEENASTGGAGYLPNSADPSGCSVVLYRTYSSANGHFYTTSQSEAQTAAAGTIEAEYCINP